LQLLSEADGGVEIARARPTAGGAEKVDPALVAKSLLYAARAETLFNFRGPCEAISCSVWLLLGAEQLSFHDQVRFQSLVGLKGPI
jgi:hypothetical protein